MLKKGFTIIELLIVIAVIAIIIGIALPKFKGMQDEANISKARGDIRMLRSAVESYKIHHGAYPALLTQLPGAVPRITGTTIPADPFNSPTTYQYARSPSNNYYVIWSYGPDGVRGVTGIDNTGAITGTALDDVYTSNGTVEWGG